MSAVNPDELRQLADLQREAAKLGQLAKGFAAATPHHVEADDSSGTVHLTLSPDGQPLEIRIRADWQRRLPPEQLAGAVIEANTNAIQYAMRAWADATDTSSWRQREPALDHNLAEQALPLGHVRDSNELAEETIKKLRAVQIPSAAQRSPIEGQDGSRNVSITLADGGLSACVIEPSWAKRHDGAAISAALSTALQAARAKLPAPPSAGHDLDALIGDALTTLTSLTATPPDRDENR